MGQGNRKQLFVHLLKGILKARGTKVGYKQLCKFLEFVEHITVKIQQCYDKHGPEKVTTDIFSLWKLIQDSLDLHSERNKVFPEQSKTETKPPALPEQLLYVDAFTKLFDDNDQLDPGNEAELEEEDAKYYNE